MLPARMLTLWKINLSVSRAKFVLNSIIQLIQTLITKVLAQSSSTVYLKFSFFFFRALKCLVPVTDFDAIEESGISPVHSAAAGAHPQCLEFLLKSGFDANFMLGQRIRKGYDDQRKSALYFAVSNADICSAQLLLNAGALPNQDPINCLQLALRMGNYELMSLLLRHGANVNYFCRVNTTHFPSALQYALKDEVTLRMLLNYGYDVYRCFDCPHGDNSHSQYVFAGWTSTVIKDTMVSTSKDVAYHCFAACTPQN